MLLLSSAEGSNEIISLLNFMKRVWNNRKKKVFWYIAKVIKSLVTLIIEHSIYPILILYTSVYIHATISFNLY